MVYDTAPEGGINIDSLRIFDLNQVVVTDTDTDADMARDWRAAISFSSPIPALELSVVGTIEFQELDYYKQDEFDFDIFDSSFGLVWYAKDKNIENTYTLSLMLQRFRSQDELFGLLLRLDLAYSSICNDKYLLWVHGLGGKLIESDVTGADSFAISGDTGLRCMWPDEHTSVQLRFFSGRLQAENEVLTNTQWGTGMGLFRKWFSSRKIWTFFEPSIRWKHHYLESTGSKQYADREYRIYTELSYSPEWQWDTIGNMSGWEVSLGYSFSKTDTASDLKNYKRHQLLFQINKKF